MNPRPTSQALIQSEWQKQAFVRLRSRERQKQGQPQVLRLRGPRESRPASLRMTRDFGLVRMILGGREGCRYISRTAIVSARSTMSAGMPSTMGYLRSQAMQTRHESSARKSAWQAGQASCAMVDAANVGGVAGLVGMACAVSDFRCQISAVPHSLFLVLSPRCGESEVHRKTTAGPSTPFAAKSAANSAQDESFIVVRTLETPHQSMGPAFLVPRSLVPLIPVLFTE